MKSLRKKCKFLSPLVVALTLTLLRLSGQLQRSVDQACRTHTALHLQKPQSHSHSLWQVTSVIDNGTKKEVYIHSFYLDNREDDYDVRGFVIVAGGLVQSSTTVNCIYWLEEHERARSSGPATVTDVQVSTYLVGNISQVTYLIRCPLPDKSLIPHHVSLSFNGCSGNVTNYVEVIKPEATSQGKQKSIGVCLTAQYGRVEDKDAAFLVQWMEAMLLFGVSSVTMYNSTMVVYGQEYWKVLDHYIQKGVLTLIQFPLPYQLDDTAADEYSAVEAVRSIAVNDCFYRNLHRHWYILHIDKDELVVPIKHRTYQEYLTHFIGENPVIRPHKYFFRHPTSQLPSLAVPSAFYYMDSESIRSDVPEHMPLLRHVYRQPTEPYGHTIGFVKSFVNPRTCNHVWSHRCLRADDERFVFLPEEDILVHHYRNRCPNKHRSLNLANRRCDTERTSQFTDEHFVTSHGEVLANRTLTVLKSCNYSLL